jgi:hypothetical protein
MVRLQQSSEPFAAYDRSIARTVVRSLVRERNHVADSLMRSFNVIMLDVFSDSSSQGFFTKEDHATQAFAFDRQNEALRERVQVRTSGGQLEGFDANAFENHIEPWRKLAVPVADEVATLVEDRTARHREVARGLPHQAVVWIDCDSAEVDLLVCPWSNR